MSDTTEKLRQELQAAQRAIAGMQSQIEQDRAGQSLATRELEENRSALLFMLEDLEAARKKVELSYQEWMAALDAMRDPMFLHDKDFRILRCNKAYQQCAGIPFKQIVGQLYYEVFPKTGTPLPCCLRAMEKAEEEVAVGDAIYRSRAFSIKNEQGAYLYSVHTLEDITESKRIESDLGVHRIELEMQNEALRHVQIDLEESRDQFVDLYEFSPVGYLTLDHEEMIDKINLTGATLLGVERNKLLHHRFAPFVATEDRDRWYRHFLDVLQHDGPQRYELALRCGDGSVLHAQLDCLHMKVDGASSVRIALTDITQRKQAEAAIQHANRALAILSAVNRTLVHAGSEEELLQSICQAIVYQRGYRMAWVGYVQHDESQSIKIMARAGYDEGYLDAVNLTWAESEHGMVPSGRAIRSGTTQLCQDVANDPAYLSWRDKAIERGYLSSIALPLTNSDVFGVLTVYAEEVNAFTPGEVGLLEEMAGDLAFGVRSLHIRRERDLALEQNQRQLAQLQNNLEDTVRAMATMLEMRDPYTAGHQAKVADLAAAIARQIGLPDEKVHAIHLAGVVHDLGKIQIPAEILSKPGRLIDIEYSLIKTHPQAGYDILKDIDFPWPIAQMVLQHHERLDGSGYPQGLRGEQIIPEARILCVADVVEAISAHRPYRPGLGIEAAFEEITKNRGILYDPQVVDACLVLFREQNYRFV